MPSPVAACWYGSGAGLPCSTSSAVTNTSGSGRPTCVIRAVAVRWRPLVAMAHRSSGRRSRSAFAPSNASTPSVSAAISSPSRSISASGSRWGATSSITSIAGRPVWTASTSSNGMPRSSAQRFHRRVMTASESTSTPSRSKMMASHKRAMGPAALEGQLTSAGTSGSKFSNSVCGAGFSLGRAERAFYERTSQALCPPLLRRSTRSPFPLIPPACDSRQRTARRLLSSAESRFM